MLVFHDFRHLPSTSFFVFFPSQGFAVLLQLPVNEKACEQMAVV